MTPIHFPEANNTLAAPAGQEAICKPLSVFCDGEQCVSCWQPTPEERAAIAAGAPIFLHVFTGNTQPPVALTVRMPTAPEAPNPGTEIQAFPA